MSELATIQNFITRDRTFHQFDVVGRYSGKRLPNSIVAKHDVHHYEHLWSGKYQAVDGYFDGHGWYTDLVGDFESEAAALAAFEQLEKEIRSHS